MGLKRAAQIFLYTVDSQTVDGLSTTKLKNLMNFFKSKFGNATADYEPLENESENGNFSGQRPSGPVIDNLEDNIIYNYIEDNSENNENLEPERQRVSVNFTVHLLSFNRESYNL